MLFDRLLRGFKVTNRQQCSDVAGATAHLDGQDRRIVQVPGPFSCKLRLDYEKPLIIGTGFATAESHSAGCRSGRHYRILCLSRVIQMTLQQLRRRWMQKTPMVATGK